MFCHRDTFATMPQMRFQQIWRVCMSGFVVGRHFVWPMEFLSETHVDWSFVRSRSISKRRMYRMAALNVSTFVSRSARSEDVREAWRTLRWRVGHEFVPVRSVFGWTQAPNCSRKAGEELAPFEEEMGTVLLVFQKVMARLVSLTGSR